MVVLVDANAVLHRQGFVTREDGSTRVAFLLGVVPVRLVSVELQVQLSLLHLRLLQAEEVGVQQLERLAEAFALAGPQSVDIP